jgi:hypothetical protein
MLITPARDARLKWTRTSPMVEQLLAVDGGTVGTIVFQPKPHIFSASTHRKYIGPFSTLQEARNAVELQWEKDVDEAADAARKQP